MPPKSTYGEFRNCASCKKDINIAVEVFLIRLDKYWHEFCFCCSACNLPIPNCKYIAFGDNVCHTSCYKRQSKNNDSSDKPKNHLVCELCKEFGKMMKCKWKSRQGNERPFHHVGETAQPSGEDSGDHRPLNSSMENSLPSRDLEELAEINKANPIPSPPSQPQFFSSNDVDSATNAEAQVFNQAADQTQGDVHSTTNADAQVFNKTADQTQGEVDSATNAEAQVFNEAANQTQGDVGTSTSTPSQQMSPMEDSATNTEAQVFNQAADQTQGDVDSATNAEAQDFNKAADQTQGDVGTSTSTPSQQMTPMEENRSVLNLVSASHDSDQLSHSSSTSSHAANPNANIRGDLSRSDLVAIFEAISAKYGDVTQNCTLSSKLFRYPFLENLCQIVKTLQTIPLHDFNDDDQLIMEMFESVADMEKVGFNVEWLNLHLVKIKKIMELNKANSALKNTRDQQLEIVDLLKNSIELKEEELSKLRSQFSEAMAKYDQIYHEIELIKSGLEQCHMDTLVDGLL